jgi:hypothetical protein
LDDPTSAPTSRSEAWPIISDLWKKIGATDPGGVDLVFGHTMPAVEIAEAWFLQSGSAGRIISIEPVTAPTPSERFENLDGGRPCEGHMVLAAGFCAARHTRPI